MMRHTSKGLVHAEMDAELAPAVAGIRAELGVSETAAYAMWVRANAGVAMVGPSRHRSEEQHSPLLAS